MAGPANLIAETKGQISSASRQVQGGLARSESGAGQGIAFPQPVEARGHEIVHQVITIRYGIEHTPYSICFGVQGYLLVTEISCLLFLGHCNGRPEEDRELWQTVDRKT